MKVICKLLILMGSLFFSGFIYAEVPVSYGHYVKGVSSNLSVSMYYDYSTVQTNVYLAYLTYSFGVTYSDYQNEAEKSSLYLEWAEILAKDNNLDTLLKKVLEKQKDTYVSN